MNNSFNLGRALMLARKPVDRALRTRVISAMCTPHHVDAYIELLDSAWSLREVRARIARVQPEAGGATSLWLQPNENWRGFRAGQYVSAAVRIDGVRYTRCFSISSAPEDGSLIRITIKALPGGRVGQWAARVARPRDVVVLSQALGDFVLPDPVPARLLFVSGGSGITPIVSLVRHLLAMNQAVEIVCVHYARGEAILGAEMAALANRHSRLRFICVQTGDVSWPAPIARGHFSLAQLESLAPSWRESETFVCGPDALRTAVAQLFHERGLAHRLRMERFVSAVQVPAAQTGARFHITFGKSGRAIDGNADVPLLDQAEGAGLRPAHGCRMGICHSCKCTKVSGVVYNQLTGAVSHENGEEIQLCVSTPRSDVVLDL